MKHSLTIPDRVPFDHGVLLSLLENYRAAKDKITRLEKDGEIIRLKRGVYISGKQDPEKPPSQELIANHLYSPSYVSFESALSYYGIIPERVFLVRSASMLRSKRFSTPLGEYEYVQLAPKVFPVGLRSVTSHGIACMMASPEKALCDQIIATKGLRIQSMAAMGAYIEQDLRCDQSVLQQLNPTIILECMEAGAKKQKELGYLHQYLTS
jgi:predicted transcriptional regulator of viral defense system